MTKALIFDFDGVLVDSNRVKIDAFFDIAQDDPAYVRAMRDVLSVMRERPRTDIFRETFRRLAVPEKILEERVAHASAAYNARVQHLLTLPAPGAVALLQEMRAMYTLFVNSATPISALQETLTRLDLLPYFEEVYGSPGSKAEHVREIFLDHQLSPDEVVIIGDGESDRASAHECRCRFVGVPNAFNGWQDTPFPLLHSLDGLGKIVARFSDE